MKVLIHSCCGPCASACVPRLQDEGHEVTMYFANSNIDTESEFEKRKGEAKKLADHDRVGFAAEPYDHGEWLKEVAAGYEREPEKGVRCERCFRYNLMKTAAYAAAHGFDAFTTSLTVSPHKVSDVILRVGSEVEVQLPSGSRPAFLPENFKKKDGFKRSLERSAELGLYRQSYCGCEFSKDAHCSRTLPATSYQLPTGFDRADGYVFDFGGVISVSPMPKWERTLYPYCESIGVDRKYVINGFQKYRRLWDSDQMSFREMYDRIFADAGLRPPTDEQFAEIVRLDKCSWVDDLREDTLALMRELKAKGKKIGILSNQSSDFFHDCYVKRCGAYRELADVEVISGIEKLYKPDPAIYRLCEERMGIPAARLCFFDDFIENVEGARALGWQSVQYPPELKPVWNLI